MDIYVGFFFLFACLYLLILILEIQLTRGKRVGITLTDLTLSNMYACLWDFNKILNWIELLCIIVLYVYMFCYVNKIIETISCLFSLNWNRMLKQWRSINNYSTSRKKNTTSKQTLNIYILMNIHVFGLRQAYIFDRVKSVNVIQRESFCIELQETVKTNNNIKIYIYIHTKNKIMYNKNISSSI
jgi:hypothetical protein